jgi:hypothetical protein
VHSVTALIASTVDVRHPLANDWFAGQAGSFG